jgi:RND family efflux transporter MFP subunit
MNKKVIAIVVAGLLLVAGGLAFISWKNKTANQSENAKKDVYYCPMHKDYVSDKPGNCPICSMKLVKQGSQDEMQNMSQEPAEVVPSQASHTSGNVFISPERQQMLGVHSVPAEYKILSREIRTVGKIAYDETRITHLHTKFNGWIEKVYADFVGEPVKMGEPLFTIYSPELVATQEEYLLALRSKEKLGNSSFEWISKGSNTLADSARERLKLWGITDEEIEQVEKTGKAQRTMTIYSPTNGIVTQRAAYHHGTYITPEMDLYTIVDISTVWLVADIYEKDLPFVKAGQQVSIEFPYNTANKLESRIEFFYPYLDPATRTGQVRIQLKNPNNQLRPDQFVNVFIKTDEQKHLVVPTDAVLNTGEQQYAFVDLGNGYFEPRQVRAGIQTPEGAAIEEGLKEGERVVTSANFLLDSEARLRGVLENMGKPSERSTTAIQPASNLIFKILEPKTPKTGDNDFEVSVKNKDGNPVSGAEVEITLSMPQMGSMPAMSNKGMLLDKGNGIYEGTIHVAGPWTWETTIIARKDNKILGSMRTTLTAR